MLFLSNTESFTGSGINANPDKGITFLAENFRASQEGFPHGILHWVILKYNFFLRQPVLFTEWEVCSLICWDLFSLRRSYLDVILIKST